MEGSYSRRLVSLKVEQGETVTDHTDLAAQANTLFERAAELGAQAVDAEHVEAAAHTLVNEAKGLPEWKSALQFAMGTATARLPDPRAFAAFRVLDSAGKMSAAE